MGYSGEASKNTSISDASRVMVIRCPIGGFVAKQDPWVVMFCSCVVLLTLVYLCVCVLPQVHADQTIPAFRTGWGLLAGSACQDIA